MAAGIGKVFYELADEPLKEKAANVIESDIDVNTTVVTGIKMTIFLIRS